MTPGGGPLRQFVSRPWNRQKTKGVNSSNPVKQYSRTWWLSAIPPYSTIWHPQSNLPISLGNPPCKHSKYVSWLSIVGGFGASSITSAATSATCSLVGATARTGHEQYHWYHKVSYWIVLQVFHSFSLWFFLHICTWHDGCNPFFTRFAQCTYLHLLLHFRLCFWCLRAKNQQDSTRLGLQDLVTARFCGLGWTWRNCDLFPMKEKMQSNVCQIAIIKQPKRNTPIKQERKNNCYREHFYFLHRSHLQLQCIKSYKSIVFNYTVVKTILNEEYIITCIAFVFYLVWPNTVLFILSTNQIATSIIVASILFLQTLKPLKKLCQFRAFIVYQHQQCPYMILSMQ